MGKIKEEIKIEIKQKFKDECKPVAVRQSTIILEKNRLKLTKVDYLDLNQLITHLKITTKN